MLQRLVRSMVSTDPRPCVMVLVPWLCSFSSLWARMSRPGKTSSRCLKNAGSIDITSSNMAVLGAFLHHQDFAVALDDGGFDFAHLLVQQDLVRELAVDDLLADLRDAARAQRIGLARPAQWRLLLLVALEQRLVRPLGGEGRVLLDLIEFIEDGPGRAGRFGYHFFGVLDGLVH
jgi:hypothetical protein